MTTRHRIDPVRMGEEIFYSIFHHIFNDEGARKHFEFSQINFFNSTEGLPGWNLWFRENTRAYQLALVQAREIPGADRPNHTGSPESPTVEGRFVIRYFPAEDDPALDQFSCGEALLRMGPVFDHTGTPSLSGQDRMDDRCFVVGYLDFRAGTGRNFVELECIAPNRWKVVRVDGLYLKTPENADIEAVAPGGIDRDVPGWDLAFFLFDKLIGGCCYAFKTAPCAAVSGRKAWIRFDIDRDNSCIETMDPDVNLFHLVTGIEIGPSGQESGCQYSVDRNAYLQAVSRRLSDEGFLLSEVCAQPHKSADPMVRAEWWAARELCFSTDAEAEMHHCCYHDH